MDLAYLAGVLDFLAVLRVRTTPQGSQLPYVGISSANLAALGRVATITGTKITQVERDYMRRGCDEHCAHAHQHIVSTTGRWSVTGSRATVVLFNTQPFLTRDLDLASELIQVGLSAPTKPAVAARMAAAGWELPPAWA